MKIYGRLFGASKYALCWALVLPGCSSLAANRKPRAFVPDATAVAWGQKVKQWAAAGVLGASLVLGTNVEPAVSVTTEPTKIELTVETDYLLRALDYYDGDMKKTLGAIVRAPSSSVRIDPPSDARDALLRGLYPFKEPEEYAVQASWLGDVSVKPENTWLDDLTEKEYKFTLPSSGEDPGLSIELSKLDIGLAAIVISYPATFGIYQLERAEEEQKIAAKQAAIKAKKAEAEQKKADAKKRALERATLKNESPETSVETRPRGPKGAVNGSSDVIPEVYEEDVPVNGDYYNMESNEAFYDQNAMDSQMAYEYAQPENAMESQMANEFAQPEQFFTIGIDEASLQQSIPEGASRISLKGRLLIDPDEGGDFSVSLDGSAFGDSISPDAKSVVVKGRLDPKISPSGSYLDNL